VGSWKKHPRKDLQEVLEKFSAAGWQVINPPKYYKVYCPCVQQHKRTIHLTPSDPNYGRNALAWMRRQTCMREHR
jgi:hypothetical protein